MISHDLLTMGVPIAEKLIRTVGVYVGIYVILRFAGKRDLAQLNSFDLVVMLLLSNIVQNAIIGNDDSLVGGLIGAGTIIFVNSLVVRLVVRKPSLGPVLEGTPTTVVTDGAYDHQALKKEGLRPADVEVAIRRQNANDVSEVEKAVLEPSGALIVTLKSEEEAATKEDLKKLERRLMAKLDRLGSR